MTKQNRNNQVEVVEAKNQDGAMKSRRRFLQVGAALAAGAVAATMFDQKESKAALQLGDVQGESNGPYAGVAGINTADGDGVLGVGTDGPAIRAHNFTNGVALRAESRETDAIDAHSESGYAIRASSDDHTAVFVESDNWRAIVGKSKIDSGVHGVSTQGVGIHGSSQENAGVFGESGIGHGVHGKSWDDAGVYGESVDGSGVLGSSSDGPGVRGQSTNAAGVIGSSDDDVGVFGSSTQIAGVRGYSPEKIGVEGLSPSGSGVEGYSVSYVGVRGNSASGIGVLAESISPKARALQVQGRAHFETAGNSIIPAMANTVFVPEELTTAESHVSVTFMGNPAPGSRPPAILYVERVHDTGFHVHLTGRVEVDTPISYLVVEPVRERVSADPNRHE